MQDTSSRRAGYVQVALLGAVCGGFVVALATRAIPRMMSQVMSEMIQGMMARMGEAGCDPADG